MAYTHRYPCIACGNENSAPRRNCRCSTCSAADQNARLRRYRDRLANGDVIRRPRRKPVRSRAWTTDEQDLDIACYRAHKERAELERQDSERMAEAKRLMTLYDVASKPRRGRPKQSIGRAENARERAA